MSNDMVTMTSQFVLAKTAVLDSADVCTHTRVVWAGQHPVPATPCGGPSRCHVDHRYYGHYLAASIRPFCTPVLCEVLCRMAIPARRVRLLQGYFVLAQRASLYASTQIRPCRPYITPDSAINRYVLVPACRAVGATDVVVVAQLSVFTLC